MWRWRLFVEWLLIGLGASIVVALCLRVSVVERADRLLYDLIAPLHAAPPDDHIIIAAIDNDTLATVGRWPWPRQAHADIIANIGAAHPAAIIYDILFIEPTADDPAVARAMAGTTPVYLPMLFDMPGPDGAPWQIHRPVEPIAGAAAGIGTANLMLDNDGRARSVSIATPDEGTVLPHLTELVYRRLTGHESPAFARTRDNGATLFIPFHAPGSFRTIPLLNIMRGELPASFLRGRIIIVGATSDGLGDLHPVSTARAGRMSGAEVQANLLSSLLADRFITPLPSGWVMLLSFLPFWALLIAFWRLTPTQGLILSAVVTLATLAGSLSMLALGGIWFPPVAALLGIAIVYPLWGWRRLAAVTQFMRGEVDTLLAQTGMGSPATEQAWSDDRVASDAGRLHQVIALMRRSAREREEMLQFLSHDMRSPQAAIIALLDSKAGAPEDREMHKRIHRYAERTLRLADDFVQLARLQSRKAPHEPVETGDAMAQAIDMVWPQAQAKHVRIERKEDQPTNGNGPDDWPGLWILGDAEALVRACTNLLINAVKASPEGGTVECGAMRDEEDVIIWVADEGPGLPPEREEDPFGRFGYSGQPDGERGSGLGLAYVEAVARRHGGKADYRAGPKGGACFSLRLPLAPGEDINPGQN
ncbi:MAG: CHASE2 domain-containing protein [Sphingobium sp.]